MKFQSSVTPNKGSAGEVPWVSHAAITGYPKKAMWLDHGTHNLGSGVKRCNYVSHCSIHIDFRVSSALTIALIVNDSKRAGEL